MFGSATPRTNAVCPITGRPSASSMVDSDSRSAHSPPSVGAAVAVDGAEELGEAAELLTELDDGGGALFGDDLLQPAASEPASSTAATEIRTDRNGTPFTVAEGVNRPG